MWMMGGKFSSLLCDNLTQGADDSKFGLIGKCRMNSGFMWSVVTRAASFYQLDAVSAAEAPPEGALVRSHLTAPGC